MRREAGVVGVALAVKSVLLVVVAVVALRAAGPAAVGDALREIGVFISESHGQ